MVESHYKRLVETSTNDVLQESNCRLLFKVESAVHGTTHIEEQSHFDWQVCFALEIQDALWRFVVIQNREVGLIQVSHELAAFIGRYKEDINLVNPFADRKNPIIRIVRRGGAQRSSTRRIGGFRKSWG